MLIERVVLYRRWILVIFYFGLAAALALYSVSFGLKFIKLAGSVLDASAEDMTLSILWLIDGALVGGLIVKVMISGYENFVSRFDEAEKHYDREVSFMGKLDSGSLKIKVASSIVAISSIHLLQIFLNAGQYESSQLMVLTGIHLAFVVSALLMGLLENIMKTRIACIALALQHPLLSREPRLLWGDLAIIRVAGGSN